MPERYFVGVDGGTESLRAAVFDARGTVLGSATTAYKTTFPKPSWAEQNPEDWWQALGSSVNAAVSSSRIQPSEIAAICLDTTCCSVVALDANGRHVRPALIWMDIRASQEAMRISSCGDEANASAASGLGAPDNFSNRFTISCTCCFFAWPLPTTACFT